LTERGRANNAKTPCITKDIIINFRVTPKQWDTLLERAGGEGKMSSYIRRKLGLKEELEGSG